MTSERFERALEVALIDLAQPSVPDYLTDILGQTADTRQRPAWASIERWLPMNITARPLARSTFPWRRLSILALLVVLAAAAIAIYSGSRPARLPQPFGPAANGLIPFVSGGDIYLGDPSTGQTRLLVTSPADESGPMTSPDGTRVAFVRGTADGTKADLYVIGVDGSNVRKITSQPIESLLWGGWTADSRRLALIHDTGRQPPGCLKLSCTLRQLDLVDADGSGRIDTIATVAGISDVQSRPPDGQELLYRAVVDDKWGLFTMDLHGATVHAVVPATVPIEMDATFGTASYTPDGGRIFYNMYTADASQGDPGCCQLFEVNADGSDPHRFIPNNGNNWDGQAVVSPDGSKIAFWHVLPNQPTQRVTIVAADGSGPVIETGPPLLGTAHWIWAPDSSKLLAFADDGSTNQAYLLDPAGGPATPVAWTSNADLDWQRLALPDR